MAEKSPNKKDINKNTKKSSKKRAPKSAKKSSTESATKRASTDANKTNESSTDASNTKPDPQELANNLIKAGLQTGELVSRYLGDETWKKIVANPDPLGLQKAWGNLLTAHMNDPSSWGKIQSEYLQKITNLMHETLDKQSTKPDASKQGSDPAAAKAKDPKEEKRAKDPRFRAKEWHEHFLFDFIRRAYFIRSDVMENYIEQRDDLDQDTKRRLAFVVRQYIDATSPSNFLPTNPTALKATLEESGENLVRGVENLKTDLERGDGALKLAHSAPDAFTVGENLATSKGKVVFRNQLMELIHYEPLTKDTMATPLLIIPPWINKFYVLDMQEKNSFIRWALMQGIPIFMISWVNPTKALSDKKMDDYMVDGPLAAKKVIAEIFGTKKLNIIGYCLGGTLLGMTMAWLAAKNQAADIVSITFFTTLLDFTDAGEIELFISEENIPKIEAEMNEAGFLDSSYMSHAFSSLRAKELIWQPAVHNYLLGRPPPAFDLLYWNDDGTRQTPAMFSFYLNNMYLSNLLKKPDAVTLAGTKLNLSKVTTPTYCVAGQKDHIAPWVSCFETANLLSGPTRFILAQAGHIAGVINPPNANKYGWRTGKITKNKTENKTSAEQWETTATEKHEGSWWPDWSKWLKEQNNKEINAIKPGEHEKYPPICDAPGKYVLEK